MKTELQVIKEQLLTYDELTIIDLLDITPEDLVDRFEDFIESNYERIQKTIDLEEEETELYREVPWED